MGAERNTSPGSVGAVQRNVAEKKMLHLAEEVREHLPLAEQRLDEIERALDGWGGSAAAEQSADERVEVTEREWQVLKLVAGGRSDKQIGAALGIKVSTVRTHLQRAMKKLHAESRVDLAAEYFRGQGRSQATRRGVIKNDDGRRRY